MSNSKKTKTVTVAFRLTEEEFAPYEQPLKEFGISKSELFRQLFLEKKVTIVAPSHDKKRLLFLYNKSSNNINQLAHSVHRAYRRGIVSERLYSKVLNTLVNIEALLLAGVNDADSG